MTSYTFESSTTHLVRLPHGSDLHDEITAYAVTRSIRAAAVSCVGMVQRASLRIYDQDGQAYRDFSFERQLDLIGGAGTISVLDDAPTLDLHATLADPDGNAFGGHVNHGTTVFAAEVTIQELHGEAPVRAHDDCTGLKMWGGTVEDC